MILKIWYIRNNFLSLTQGIYENLTDNILLHVKDWMLNPWGDEQARKLPVTTSIKVALEVQVRSASPEKEVEVKRKIVYS